MSKDITLPNALIIGPWKAGTTWVHDYLCTHSDVTLPSGVKETYFFDRRYDKGIAWYAKHFGGANVVKNNVIAEVAPSYFCCPEAPERIHDTLGPIPLVITLRDPIQRAWSHYLHLRRYGYTSASLRDAVESFPEIIEASRYKTCIQRWQACFARKNISVLWLESLSNTPERYAADLCRGLLLPFKSPHLESQRAVNVAAMPRSTRLAKFGKRTAEVLHEQGMHGPVNFAKRIGLKNVFFGRPGSGMLPSFDEADVQWLTEQLAGEMPDEPSMPQLETTADLR